MKLGVFGYIVTRRACRPDRIPLGQRGKRVRARGRDPHLALSGSPRKVSVTKMFWKRDEFGRHFK
jgi:hypothetical protein